MGFAEVYDKFMDNVPYDEWAEYLIGLLKENGVKDGLVAELGCGTGNVTTRLKAAGYEIAESEVEFIPSMESKVDDESAIKALHKLIDTLDDNDDVQRVSYNCDLPDME